MDSRSFELFDEEQREAVRSVAIAGLLVGFLMGLALVVMARQNVEHAAGGSSRPVTSSPPTPVPPPTPGAADTTAAVTPAAPAQGDGSGA